MRKDEGNRYGWRIRNMPWPKETYQVTIDHAKQEIVLRTTNKKYFKRIEILEMKRIGLQLEEASVAYKYTNSTLLIYYDKPPKILELEAKKKAELSQLKSTTDDKDGKVECNNQ